jgi:hypothetical protein
MALTPNFDRIVATITAADIDKFLHSAAPDDDKQRVRDASSNEIRMRLIGGYLIHTNQITPARLNPKLIKAKISSNATKAVKATRSSKSRAVTTVAEVHSTSVHG